MAKRKARDEGPTQQVTVRLEHELLARLDRHAETLSETTGIDVTRADVMRMAVVRLLDDATKRGRRS